MVIINGGYLAAGGQILRTATALAAIKKIPCHIFAIRKGRPNPGLATQHLLGLQTLSRLCNGRLEGDFLGSTEIKFYPGEITKEKISLSIPTAASVTLILQSLIPPALFAPEPIKISFDGGATDTFFSPSIDHFRYIFLKILEKITQNEKCSRSVEVNIIKRGYYPEGGAKVEVKIFPSRLKPINFIERGKLEKILVISGASSALKDKKVSERQLIGMREILKKLKLPIEERVEYYDTKSPGSQICIICEFQNSIIGVDNLGKLGKPAESIGREAALELLREEKTKACLDRHLADQVLPYMALAQQESQVTVSDLTLHAKTNIWTIEKFIPGKFEVKGNLIKWIPKH